MYGRLQGSRSIRWAARTGSFLAHRRRGSPDEERGQRLHPVQGSPSLAVSRWLWERSKRIVKTAFRVKWLCSNSFFFVYQTRSLDFRRGKTVHARMRLGADHLRDDGGQGAVQDEHHPQRWHRGDDGELGIRSIRPRGQDVPQEKPGNKEMKPRTIFFRRPFLTILPINLCIFNKKKWSKDQDQSFILKNKLQSFTDNERIVI